jgi:hypothetical protein
MNRTNLGKQRPLISFAGARLLHRSPVLVSMSIWREPAHLRLSFILNSPLSAGFNIQLRDSAIRLGLQLQIRILWCYSFGLAIDFL